MKQNICLLIIAVGLLAIIGIVGGVDFGKPLSNALWCFPIMLCMWLAALAGDLSNHKEDK